MGKHSILILKFTFEKNDFSLFKPISGNGVPPPVERSAIIYIEKQNQLYRDINRTGKYLYQKLVDVKKNITIKYINTQAHGKAQF